MEKKLRPETKTISDLSRWEALDMVFQVNKAMEQGKFGTACVLLGMGEDLGPMTFEELNEIMMVRFTTVAKIAGIKLNETFPEV